jgi:hypothetical protein
MKRGSHRISAQYQKDPGDCGDAGDRGMRGGEQVPDVTGGLPVKAEAPTQPAGRRLPGHGICHDEEREGAQRQRAGEDHALVQEIHRIEPTPENISR